MPLTPGMQIGAYEILDAIGAGGMGEVYRARDTRLKREVAIKVLPEEFASEPERLARFQREAELLATLNHSNIAAIYGLEQARGRAAIVLEFVDGQTLADIVARGPVAAGDALRIARQIAAALEAAHDRGIIHRDLKPANIKVRDDGTVKVLDFGLAKALDDVAHGASRGSAVGATPFDRTRPPASDDHRTQAGVILGTPAYMAPEQAKGRAADKRSDLWAFGCVLFEMLSGKRAFEANDDGDILAAVLGAEPDWTALPANLPASVRTLVQRCLAKDRRDRVADIAAALFVLSDPASLSSSTAAASTVGLAARPQSRWQRLIPFAATAFVAGAAVGLAQWLLRPPAPTPIVTRFSLWLPENEVFTMFNRRGVSVSPDGMRVAYMAGQRLYVRAMSDATPKALISGSLMTNPAFSPDGQSIAFYSETGDGGQLKRIAVSGGTPVVICAAENPYGLRWTGDHLVFGQSREGVFRVAAGGGKPERIVTVNPDEQADTPQILPGSASILFTLAKAQGGLDRWDRAQIVVQSLRTGERQVVVDGGSDGQYLPTGHLLYANKGTLLAATFDPKRPSIVGTPVPIVEGVLRASQTTGAAQFSVSSTGTAVFVPGPVATGSSLLDLAFVDQQANVEPLNLPPGPYKLPRISPDGRQVAFASDDTREAAVWIYDLSATSALRRLTFGGRNQFPAWTADNQRVTFQSDREGDKGIYWQRADGSGPPERLTTAEPGTEHIPESWSPGGDVLLFSIRKGASVQPWTFSARDRKSAPFPGVQNQGGALTNATFSPDGRWVAYVSGASGPTRIQVQPFPPTGATYQIPTLPDVTGHVSHPLWSPDGRRLFFIPAGTLGSVDVAMQPAFTVSRPMRVPRGFASTGTFVDGRPYDFTRDGTRFVGVVASGPTESGSSRTAGLAQLRVVLNWFEELRAKSGGAK